jgi:threonine synthase
MKLYSTKHTSPDVNFEEAIFKGLPNDNGLYMPYEIPKLSDEFIHNLEHKTLQEIAFEVSHNLIGDEIPKEILKKLIDEAINFEAPVKELTDSIGVLELFHGPSLAFKDFGARFMSRIMGHFLKKSSQKLNILVATSGDTGGAVAMGFLNTPGIEVTILYPTGKVSNYQEMQLTSLGGNIKALEVNGTFDDCQRLVKEAFLDEKLSMQLNLSSANSINISRLIPQTFYYFNAIAQMRRKGIKSDIVFCVPSGNFGNIGAGLLAKRMGLPVHKFVAATNANDIFTQYLNTGAFNPRPSVKTLSNAMDVGNPSNYQRISDLYSNDVEKLRGDMASYSFTDAETEKTIVDVYAQYGYMMCPHTAVGYLGLTKYLKEESRKDLYGVLLSTAHPAKFVNELRPEIAAKVSVPKELSDLLSRKKEAKFIQPEFEQLKSFLLNK